MLHSEIYGVENAGRPLVIAHGLFGSSRNWRAIAKQLAKHRPVHVVDMRNHGNSFWDPSHDYPSLGGDLVEVLEGLGGNCDLIGHSMGGKAAMVAALLRPDLLEKFCVVDIAPTRYSHSQQGGIDAMRSVDLAQVTRRADAEEILKEQVKDAPTRAFFLQSLIAGEEGYRWALNLDALSANMANIIGFPQVEGQFEGPSLFLYGGKSDYVRPEHHAEIFALFPKTRFEEIPEAGHWVQAEAPRAFIEAVSRFLETE